MQPDDSIDQQIVRSWTDNADAWTRVVREGLIPSRGAGTDAAIVRACVAVGRGPMLDVGCGEGWLVRELARRGIEAHGIDVSEALVMQASARGGSFAVATYAQLEADHRSVAGPWQAIVCNFALLGDPLHPLLAALRTRLVSGGTLLIQTVHPWTARGDAPYRAAWRTECFEAFGTAFPAPMPWFYRPLASWHDQFALAGLRVTGVDEPVHPDTGNLLSLLFRCEAA